jgi:hypothetical protein
MIYFDGTAKWPKFQGREKPCHPLQFFSVFLTIP